jgi:hypothetical protein
LHNEDAPSAKLAKGIRHTIECFLFGLRKKAEYFRLDIGQAEVAPLTYRSDMI